MALISITRLQTEVSYSGGWLVWKGSYCMSNASSLNEVKLYILVTGLW